MTKEEREGRHDCDQGDNRAGRPAAAADQLLVGDRRFSTEGFELVRRRAAALRTVSMGARQRLTTVTARLHARRS